MSDSYIKLITSWLFLVFIYLAPVDLMEALASTIDVVTAKTGTRKLKVKIKEMDVEAGRNEEQDEEDEDTYAVFELPETPPPTTPPSTPRSPTPEPPRRPRYSRSIGRGRGKCAKVHPYLKKEPGS